MRYSTHLPHRLLHKNTNGTSQKQPKQAKCKNCARSRRLFVGQTTRIPHRASCAGLWRPRPLPPAIKLSFKQSGCWILFVAVTAKASKESKRNQEASSLVCSDDTNKKKNQPTPFKHIYKRRLTTFFSKITCLQDKRLRWIYAQQFRDGICLKTIKLQSNKKVQIKVSASPMKALPYAAHLNPNLWVCANDQQVYIA